MKWRNNIMRAALGKTKNIHEPLNSSPGVCSVDTFCIQEWEVLVDLLVQNGAIAVIVGNDFPYTYTMVDSDGSLSHDIPVYNLRQERAMWLESKLTDPVYVTLPGIRFGQTKFANTTDFVDPTGFDIPLTELQLLRPNALRQVDNGVVLAGQSDLFYQAPFDFEFERGSYYVELAEVFAYCDSTTSCHYCNMLNQPIINSPAKVIGKVSERIFAFF